jgi:hypothetical protein
MSRNIEPDHVALVSWPGSFCMPVGHPLPLYVQRAGPSQAC